MNRRKPSNRPVWLTILHPLGESMSRIRVTTTNHDACDERRTAHYHWTIQCLHGAMQTGLELHTQHPSHPNWSIAHDRHRNETQQSGFCVAPPTDEKLMLFCSFADKKSPTFPFEMGISKLYAFPAGWSKTKQRKEPLVPLSLTSVNHDLASLQLLYIHIYSPYQRLNLVIHHQFTIIKHYESWWVRVGPTYPSTEFVSEAAPAQAGISGGERKQIYNKNQLGSNWEATSCSWRLGD